MTPNNTRLLTILADRAGLDADTAMTIALTDLIRRLNLGHLLTIKPAKATTAPAAAKLSNGMHLFTVGEVEVDRFTNRTVADMTAPDGTDYRFIADINLAKWIGTHLKENDPQKFRGQKIKIICHGGVPVRTSDDTVDGFLNDSVKLELTG